MILKSTLFSILCFIMLYSSNADDVKNKGKFSDSKNEYMDRIQDGIKNFNKKDSKASKRFKVNTENLNIPKSITEFKTQWHNPPLSQGATGTCWSFSTTSFLESEIKRTSGMEIKLSEMFTVYWEYVEKAIRFVEKRGESEFGEGSQANAVNRIWKKYGCVPESVYNGMLKGQEYHDHSKMYNEMRTYLNFIKEKNVWNKEEVVANIKSILNFYMGEAPSEFNYEGKKYTPITFLNDYLKIQADEYVDMMSLMQYPYWQQAEYVTEDNWWHSDIYYNIPLDDYINGLKNAIKKGYTAFIGGDVSESGLVPYDGVALVPSYDIPSSYINDDARQFRFDNKTTTDDHGIHIVGYEVKDGKIWFLIKDSGSSAHNNPNKGYFFYHEDYVKLKMMNFMVHKSAVEDILKKFGKPKPEAN